MQVNVMTNVSDIDGFRLCLIPVREKSIQSSQSIVASLRKTIALAVEVVLYSIKNLYRPGVSRRGGVKASQRQCFTDRVGLARVEFLGED